MKIDAKTVEEYIDKAGKRGGDIAELDAFIRKHAPDAKPVGEGGDIREYAGIWDYAL